MLCVFCVFAAAPYFDFVSTPIRHWICGTRPADLADAEEMGEVEPEDNIPLPAAQQEEPAAVQAQDPPVEGNDQAEAEHPHQE